MFLMGAIGPFCEEQRAEICVKFEAASEALILRSFLQRGQSESRTRMSGLPISRDCRPRATEWWAKARLSTDTKAVT